MLPSAVLLVGPSTVGKTSVAKELQQRIGSCMRIGVDSLIETCAPPQQKSVEQYDEFTRLCMATAGCWLEQGYTVVIDTVTWRNRLRYLPGIFAAESRLYIVVLRCPLEVLEARALTTPKAVAGLAARQYDEVYRIEHADLELHTDVMSAAECADRIADRLRGAPRAYPLLYPALARMV